MIPKRGTLLAVAASLVLLMVGVWADVDEPRFAATLRNATFDAYQRWRPREYRPAPVRILDIDDESLARLGQWPWSRTRLAEIVDRLRALGAAAIAFDVVFAEPDRTAPAAVLRQWGDLPEAQGLLRRLPDPDRVFAEAVAKGGVITGFSLESSSGGLKPAEKSGFAIAGDDPKHFLKDHTSAVTTLPEIEAKAAGNGAFNFISDSDGVLRRLPLVFRMGETLYPALAAEALRVMDRGGGYVIKSSGASGESRFGGHAGIVSVRVGNHVMPTDAEGRVWIPYTLRVPERSVPVWKLLENAVRREDVAGAIVLVGTSAVGLKDLRFSPLGGTVPGVEVHAQALEAILGNALLERPDVATAAEVVFLVASWLVLVVLVFRLGPLWSAIIGGLAIAAAWLTSWYAFAEHRLLFDPLLPSATAVSVYLVCSVSRHLQTEGEKRWIRKAFSSYIAPNLVEHLIKNPGELRLKGERRECSFVLTDLEGFTPLIERSDPEQLVSILNEYFEGMIAIVFAHGGTLDRIVGDALVVMFSAPVPQPDHAARAVACALAIDRFAEQFRAAQNAAGVAFGHTRIGVNSGFVIVGNIGGKSLFDYRALGDAINVAARLETVNRQLGTRVCVSETAATRCPEFVGRPVGVLHLKGKAVGVLAFEPLTRAELESPTATAYLAAYRLLESKDPRARDAFAALGDDPLAAFHLQRLERGDSGVEVGFTEK